jgi:hypothetical protein
MNDDDREQTAVTRAALTAAYPEFAAELERDAIREERARIQTILRCAPIGQLKLAWDLAFDEAVAPGDAAIRLLEAALTTEGGSLGPRGH